MIRLLIIVNLLLVLANVGAQKPQKSEKSKTESVTAKSDAGAKDDKAKADKDKPKPYGEVIDSTAVTQWGLWGVHKVKDKWYFEIADSTLNVPVLAITRYSKTAAGGGIYGGENIKNQMFHWERGPANKIFMRGTVITVNSPDSSKPIFQSVQNSNLQPIMASFDIKSLRKVGNMQTYVIDVTDFFNGDEYSFGLGSINKQRFRLKGLQKDASFINKMSAYPINVEVRTTKTYDITPPSLNDKSPVGTYLPAGSSSGFVTVELNTSMIMLPKNPMKKRNFDSRVGFFSGQRTEYEENSQKADVETFIVRWRLEPRNEADREKQRRGVLIEPAKKIVYYIDPATPAKWRPYLIQGIDDWNRAFEQAGWKNAIEGRLWPENDTTMSLEDARYSVIRYFASDIQNAYGPNVHDPRTGEIIESHIGWYHNIMRLLRNWYLIQAGATDSRAGNIEFDDNLMGELIRFVSSHEVGHTLGLRHNMGASFATPVEKLRDNNWVSKNGHTSSIMDYARFNYVAQPEDGVTDLFPRIGDYDKWAIEWGYTFMDTRDQKVEDSLLNIMVKKAYENPRLHFGTEISQYDPRFQREDLGDNAMKASAYGIKNLKRIMPNLEKWSSREGKSYAELEELYNALIGQYRRYMGHVAKNIGGVYEDPKTSDMSGQPFRIVPVATQQEAIQFLNEYVFTAPTWLADVAIISKIRPDAGVEAIKGIQQGVINDIFSGDKLIRLMEYSSKGGYSFNQMLNEIEENIIGNQDGRNIYQRNLQKIYVGKLIELLKPGSATAMALAIGTPFGSNRLTVNLDETDVPSIARGHLSKIRKEIKGNLKKADSEVAKYHNIDLLARIDKALKVD
ncbi:MAG: zinc-dependent metalloprotease [Saprospiraceae bacterium]|nr:zinc-dependent metalloprotease [Saprospiraceae bacterium]